MKNNNTIVDVTRFGRIDVFEITEKFPAGYILWAIGRENFPHVGYVPLAKKTGAYTVSTKGLKALNVGDEDLCMWLLDAAITGNFGEINVSNFPHLCDKYKHKGANANK